jgi:endoglucanase
MVGGPLESDRYWDWRDDWVQNEVALDYNANLPAIAAMMVSTVMVFLQDED